jgi:hypothetical protein
MSSSPAHRGAGAGVSGSMGVPLTLFSLLRDESFSSPFLSRGSFFTIFCYSFIHSFIHSFVVKLDLVKHRSYQAFPPWQEIHQPPMTLGLFGRVGESGNMLLMTREQLRRDNDGNDLINDEKREDTNRQLLNLPHQRPHLLTLF